jgi:hypothetical protein
VGAWSEPPPRGSRSVSWPPPPGCHPRGCTSSWPMPTWMRWTRRSASCEQRAGPPPKIRTPGRTPDSTAATASPTWLRLCADWLAHLDADSCPPGVNLRPSADWPDRAVVAVDLARVRAVIDRIAADVDELARARRFEDLDTAAVLLGRRAERRRRLAEPDLEFRASAPATDCPPHRPRSWSAPGTHGRPNGTGAARSASDPPTPATRSGHADHPPAVPAFRKLDAVAVLTARLLPAPLESPEFRRTEGSSR